MSEAAAETYREIIAKTVCVTARKSLKYTHYIDPPRGSVPSQILGCSVFGLKLEKPEVKESNGAFTLQVGGKCEIHVWYACSEGKETDVLQHPVKFDEIIPLDDFDHQNTGKLEAIIKRGKKPMVLASAIIEDQRIKLDIKLDISAEVIDETKLLVQVCGCS